MATGVGELLEEMTDRLLVCEICQEDFQAPGRLPRVLPCHHAFCSQCLQLLVKDAQLSCPLCRRSISVEGAFPVDITRMTLLELKKAVGAREGPGCEGCSKEAQACSRCMECQELLCQACCRSHRRVSATREHRLVSLAEAAQDPGQLVQREEKCGKHGGNKVEFYCCDCHTAVCSACFLVPHRDHKLEELEPVLKMKRKEMSWLCGRLQAIIPRCQDRVTASNSSLETLGASEAETAEKIKSICQEIVQKVSERQDQLLTDLGAKIKGDRLALEGQLASDESLLSEAQASLQFSKCVTSLGLPSQLLPAPQEMTETCTRLEKQSVALALPAPRYQPDTTCLAELTALLDKVGDIIDQPPENKYPFLCPEFRFDASKCNLQCSVSGKKKILTNDPRPRTPFSRSSQRCGFQGACTKEPLPDESCYWQVRWVFTSKPSVSRGYMCEAGLLEQEPMFVPRDIWSLPNTPLSLGVRLETDGTQVAAVLSRGVQCLSMHNLGPISPDGQVDVVLGFLLDKHQSRLHVIEAGQLCLLGDCQVTLTKPLWPVVAAKDQKEAGPIRMELQSGEGLTLSSELTDLLKFLLQKKT